MLEIMPDLQSGYAWTALLIAAIAYVLVAGTRKAAPKLPFHSSCKQAVDATSKSLRQLLVRIIRQGRIPQHIAFIMDGNRRYARKRQRVASSGHVSGFYRLAKVLEWCNDLGVGNVSVFAFAINNFNRTPEEVKTLMDLAESKLRELAEKSDLVQRHGVRICVIGNRSLLSQGVQEAAEFAEQKTMHNRGMRLNICFPYSATDEISSAIRKVVEDVDTGKLQHAEIDEKALESRLQIPGPDLDILVRTSGQIRFSNYMLWQSVKMAYIRFVDVFWPDFSFFHMICILISWQLAYNDIQRRKQLRK